MLESVVSTLLNRVLGAYVSNLNYSQLKVGIWSGEVTLRDLKLRREALDKFNLPVDVLEGYLGELTLTIPWNNLRGKPVVIHVKDAYVLAVPRNESTMTADELAQRDQDAKMRKLENAELMVDANEHDAAEDAKNDTFANQLLTKILNNLQFSITNIHIRYEDDISTDHRFAAGVTLSELSAITTDENWIANTISETVNTIHKLATLESLSVYWDTNAPTLSQNQDHAAFKDLIATKHHVPDEHQYVLKPVSGTGRVKLYKNFGGETPKIDANLLFDELSFAVDNEQYRDTILMIDLFHSYLKKQKYKKLHPPSNMTPKSNPLDYFRFAGNAVLSEIHERNERWTWKRIKKRSEDRKQYLACYVQHKLDRASPEELETLHALERELSYEDLRFYRSLAKPKLRSEKARLAAIEKRRKEEAAANRANQGWGISNWWYGTSGSNSNNAAQDEALNEDLVITEEQKLEFYDVIDYDADKAAIAASIDLPKDTMLLSLTTSLNKGSFTVRKDPHDKPLDLVSLVFDNVSLGMIQYVESFTATAALGDLCLYDGIRVDSPYYKLMGAKDKDNTDEEKLKKRRKSSSAAEILSQATIQDPFFTVKFEHKPLDNRADNAVALFMRNIDIVYNPLVIHEIVDFFKPPETSADSINALIEVAGDTLEDIKNQTRASLEFALDQHTTFDLQIDMDAPVIIIPEDCSSITSRGIVMDAGHINVESRLAPPDALTMLKSKSAADMTIEDNMKLRELMYDKFTVQLTQTKILVGSIETCLVQVRTPREELRYLHLVDRIDMTFLAELCIIRKSVDMPRFKISGHLPLLKVNFSDTKYRGIMQLPRLIDASGLLGDKKANEDVLIDSDYVAMEKKNQVDQRWFNLMNTPLWSKSKDDVFVDTDSEHSSSDKDDADTVETSATEISKPNNSKNKDMVNMEERMFELNFKVDRVLANVLEAQHDAKADVPETLLCQVDLQNLVLGYSMRPMDMTVHLTLQSLDVTDRMKHGNEFKYLVTSDQYALQPGQSHGHDEQLKNLVNVEYVRCDKASPEYVSKYKGIDQTVQVTLSTLNFVVTRSSVLQLHNFILHTFVDEEVSNNNNNNTRRRSSVSTPAAAAAVPVSATKDSSSIYVRLLLDSVNFVLNNDGVRLATGELSLGDLSTIILDGQVNVAAKFANFTLTDNLTPTHNSPQHLTSNQLLTIQGEELIDLRYNSYINDGREGYPGYDHALYVRMGSAQFNFLEQPIHQFMDYLSKFAEMKSTYDMARQAALESAQQLGQAATKMHFDVVIETPVVLFPENHQHASDVVVAHLGEIWASNTFVDESDGCINTIKAGLRAINLTSKFNIAQQLQTLPIVDDIDLNLDIKIPQQESKTRPGVDICGSIKDVTMRLTERQYVFLMDAINMFSRVFSSQPEDTSVSGHPGQDLTQVAHESSSSHKKTIEMFTETDKSHDLPRIQITLDAKTIGLEIYKNNADTEEKNIQKPDSLARIALNNTDVKFHMYNDDSMDVHLVVHSLTVDDTRPGINSKFKHIVPVIEDGHQFELQLDLKEPDPVRSGIVVMTVKDPKVILSLDHAFLLRNFFTLPFNEKAEEHRSPNANQEQQQGMELSYLLTIVNAEFILLANPDHADSEAVVLSTKELLITQQTKTALVVKQMGMFLCRMDMRKKSTLRFIQPFDVNLSMNGNPKNDQGGLLTDLVMNIDPLVLRLSYRDAMLVTDIFNKAYELYSTSMNKEEDASAQQTTAEYAQSLISPSSQKDVDRLNEIALAQESLRISFHGAQIVLIEELHETPMVDMNLKPFNVEVANWSKALSATVEFQAYINYFNIKNSHWEPLMEPWNFRLELARNSTTKNDPLNVKLISNSILNVNITHTFLESAYNAMHLMDKQKNTIYSGERGTVAPYELRNRTGYNIMVWNSTNAKEGPVIQEIKDGSNKPWWFEDWKTRRETTSFASNNLNVQIDGAMWESLRDIKLDTEGEHMHALRPMVKNVQHRIVFDVKLVDNIKIVTIRSSLVIENRTLLSVDVASIDPSGNMDGSVKKVAPGEDYAIPIEKAYTNRFCIRPDAGFGYRWTEKAFHWKDFASPAKPQSTFSCLAEDADNNMPPFIFQINARLDKKSILFGQYPVMGIRLSAPIEIENLLPFDFNFRIVDKTSGQDFSSYLRKGGITPIHVIENGHLVLLNVEMPDTDYKRSEYAIISTKRTDDLDIDHSIELVNRKDKSKLNIRINTLDIPDSGGAKKYSIFSPYIIINKTGLPISFKEKPAWAEALYSAGETVTMCKPGPKPEPFMYSYPNVDNRNRTLIQVDHSDWSQPLSFEAIGSVYDVALPNAGRSEEIHVGINVQEGQGKFKLTKTITITPRFVLSNQTDENIRYRVPETKNDYILEAHQRIPLYNIRVQNEKQLTIKLEGYSNAWSAPFNIQDIGDVHIRLANDYGNQDTLIKVSTLIQDATIFIVLRKEEDNNWPYLLVNKTSQDMIFYQEDPVVLRDDYSSVPVRNPRIKRYRLLANSSVPYSWDLPAYKDKKIILNINGRERSINLQEIGNMLPFRHTTREGTPAITSIDVKIRGSRRILELKPFSQSESLFKPVSNSSLARVDSSASVSSADTIAKEGFEAADMDMSVNAVFQIQLKEVGISIINRQLQELAYATLKGIDLKLTDSAMYHSLRWNIDWVQIDNQMYGSVFPILLYPTNLTDNGNRKDNKMLPTVQMALDRVKDDSHGVVYFKYFSILLQEMSIELDETFVYAVMDLVHIDDGSTATDPTHDAKLWEYTTDIPDVKPHDNIAQIYFEVFSIQPIRFDLSFLRSGQEDDKTKVQQTNTPLMYLVNALTMAIGNINQAPLRFNALAIENIMASGPDLANRISIHYSDQLIYQVHRILGSADFLGNPVGLFNNLSSGVAELFYEPWQGLIMSDRPQDLGYGIAKGFGGFVKKSVFGVSDSFTKFTGSIGKGLSAATMDREYQDRRRMNMARNRPKHALVGVAQGATSFANSVTSGFSGLVTRPMEGATKDGVGGFFKGFGKGLVGAVTKPVVGVFDFTSNVTEGIRNTTTPTDTNMIERVRYPRYIGTDGLLKPYSLREAIGQHWLKDVDGGKYMDDTYIAHCHVQNDERVAMLTTTRVMLIRTRKLSVEWQEPFTEIQTIKREPTGIAIYLRSMSWEPFLIISDKHSREDFFKKIEEAVIKYNSTRRPNQ
ncbi:Vacuolar protein sorting-associated protein 13 [Mucor circinelloides]